MLPRVFICSAFGGLEPNVRLAREYCTYALKDGTAPIAPHLIYPQILTESPEERALGIEAGLSYLAVCDEVWAFCVGGILSEGMRIEVDAAIEQDIPIRWFGVVPGSRIVPLKHLPSDRIPSLNERMIPSVYAVKVSATFAYISTQLRTSARYELFTDELDTLLGNKMEERDQRVEAEWLLSLQGNEDE